MLKALPFAVLASSLLGVTLASADPPEAPKPASPPAPSAVRKDPHGIKGISPFREALNKGDSALAARDVDGALAIYQAAISNEPQNPLGYYRIGEALIEKGTLHEAQEAFTNGLRFVSAADAALKAKLQFALADARERQKNWDEASAQWSEYQAFASQQKLGFPDSGAERKRTVEVWKKLSADAAEVKARIQKNIAAADEAVRKSSK